MEENPHCGNILDPFMNRRTGCVSTSDWMRDWVWADVSCWRNVSSEGEECRFVVWRKVVVGEDGVNALDVGRVKKSVIRVEVKKMRSDDFWNDFMFDMLLLCVW